MEHIKRGFHLVGVSWQVLRSDRKLLILPLLSLVSFLLLAGLMAAAAFGIGIPKSGESPNPILYVLLFVFYVLAAFVSIFFNAAMIGAVTKKLKGEDATVGDGITIARQHIGQIFVWSVITATVGMILRSLSERAGLLGRIVLGFIGVAWAVITFFVVPVMLFEDIGPIDAIKRSASIFKQKWGEQFTGNAAIGIAIFVAGLPIILVAVLLGLIAPWLGIAVGVLAFGVLSLIGAALSGIFNAALYQYAVTGTAVGGFDDDDLSGAFSQKRTSGLGSGSGGFGGGIAGS